MAKSKSAPAAGKAAVGRVTFLDGQNELPMVQVTTEWSTAEIYLHGAHVTRFQKKGEPPLLFMSQCSRFEPGHAIRGGVPVILPWFGMREGMGMHGFARVKSWDLKEVIPAPDGSVSVRFELPDVPEASSFPPFKAEYTVTVNQSLTLELVVTNKSQDVLPFENCLHTYFEVGDITTISVEGLKGLRYVDKVANFAKKTETQDAIRINSEVDRVYLDTTSKVEVKDPRLNRKIVIDKHGSVSTVLWNPWIEKAHQMPDFGNEEYLRMVCVESGNVASNAIKLPPGETSKLSVKLRTGKL